MGSRRQSRIIAFQALYSQEMNSCSCVELLQLEWLDPKEKQKLDSNVLYFARLLIQGTIENLDKIDQLIQNHLVHWDFERVSKVDLAILRLSVFQMLYMKEVPIKVVIDEAIDIAKKFSTDESYRFINGVLDNLMKEEGL